MPAKPKKPRPLPSALVARARDAAKRAKSRGRARAHELLTLINDKKRVIADAFWDTGVALAELRRAKLHAELGYRTFEAMLAKECELSLAQAEKLIGITEQLPRSKALALGQEKAAALVELSAATRRADSADELTTTPVATSGRHREVVASSMSTREIKRAARELRRAHDRKSNPHAALVREGERVAKELQAALRAHDLPHAKVEALAVRRKGESETIELRITVPLDGRAALRAVLGKKAGKVS